VNMSGSVQNVSCLIVRRHPRSGASIPDMIAAAYGGHGAETTSLCGVNPWAAPLTYSGFSEVAALGSVPHMKIFARRVIAHLGSMVAPDKEPIFADFAGKYASKGTTFFDMVAELRSPLSWLEVDADAACVADRNAQPDAVMAAVAWMCKHANSFSCSDAPAECSGTPYRLGDYVFSRYYKEHRGYTNPLVSCYSDGAAVFAPSRTFLRNAWSRQCVQGADTLPEPAQSLEEADMLEEVSELTGAPAGSSEATPATVISPGDVDVDVEGSAPASIGSGGRAEDAPIFEDLPLDSAALRWAGAPSLLVPLLLVAAAGA